MSNQYPNPPFEQNRPAQHPQGFVPPQPRLPDPFPPQPPKKHTARNIVIGAVVGIFLLIGSCTAIIGGAASSIDTSTEPSSAAPSIDNGPTPDPITTPTNKPTQPAPTAKATQPAKPSPKPTVKPKPVVYKKLTSREWAKVAKSPGAHTGEAYIVYGVVTQFDSATGDDQFRADVGGVRQRPSYGFVNYPTNTLMTNFSGDVSDLVEDDLFTAKVIVLGSFSYDTQIGGNTTVPQLQVMSLSVTGNLS